MAKKVNCSAEQRRDMTLCGAIHSNDKSTIQSDIEMQNLV